MTAKSWPFEQARALLKRVEGKKMVTFQTGFGPSGAPHVGTFGEVVRTQMVRHAFEHLTGGEVATQLIVFSDDYDGFRKVPDGLPESMEADLGKPLSNVNDPFGDYRSFAERNNTALRNFLDGMGIDYKFSSATDCYRSGLFNEMLIRVCQNYEAVRNIMLPTLGEVRRATYSPIMPISPVTGNVLAEGVRDIDLTRNEIHFTAEDGKDYSVPVEFGKVKLQWKADWGMRWAALGVDYEMHGKDLIDSAVLSSRICKAIGGVPPLTYFYELFLDEHGAKQSKSKGNGMSTKEWLQCSTSDTLAMFMFQSPKTAKTFAPSVIPRVTDEYLKGLAAYDGLTPEQRLDSPVWHIHEGVPPSYTSDVSYGLLLNLAKVSAAQDAETLMNYLYQYRALPPQEHKLLWPFVEGAVAYVREHVEKGSRRDPTALETAAFRALIWQLEQMEDGLDGEAYQFHIYEIGKQFQFEPLRNWFKAIYEVLFGDEQGPRFGTFIAAYGRERTIELLRSVLR